MIYNMYDTKDVEELSKLRKTPGIQLTKKYLPRIDANIQGYVVNTLEEWQEIKDRFPEIVTCRTDSRIDLENINQHGATRPKDGIDDYIIEVSNKFKNPYFICLELEEGTNERIYTQGGFVLDCTVGEDIKIGYCGPGFDCGEITKGLSEHESWVIPWNASSITNPNTVNEFRINKISDKEYRKSVVNRMVFLIKEYPYRKKEICDEFFANKAHYSGITPELFETLQKEVLIPIYRSQKDLIYDGLNHFGIEINVVKDNRLVPFEIETPAIFKVEEKEDSYLKKNANREKSRFFSQTEQQKNLLMRYGKAKGMILTQKYLPKLYPFNGIRVISSKSQWEAIQDKYPDRLTTRTDTLIGDTRNVRIDGTGGKKELISGVIDQIKEQNPEGVLLLLDKKTETLPRYENDGGFNVQFNNNESVIIELTGKGFDAREITREKGVHERYVIPWDLVLFMRNKSDLLKNRFVDKEIISDKDYEKSREERIKFLKSVDENIEKVEDVIPKKYKPINSDTIKNILDDIVFEVYKRQADFYRDGLKNFNVQGNIVRGKLEAWEIFRPERLIPRDNKNRKQQEDMGR